MRGDYKATLKSNFFVLNNDFAPDIFSSWKNINLNDTNDENAESKMIKRTRNISENISFTAPLVIRAKILEDCSLYKVNKFVFIIIPNITIS